MATDATSLRELKAKMYTRMDLFGLGPDEGPKGVAGVGFPGLPSTWNLVRDLSGSQGLLP